MAKKLTEKYNDACIKLFEFIKMLYNDEAEFKKVLNLFSNGNYDGTSNTHVTLNKYLNALKVFGLKVKKINKHYKILSPLYKLSFDTEDIKSIQRLKDAKTLLPNGTVKDNFEKFIRNIEIRFDENAQNVEKTLTTTQNINLDFYHSELIEQVKLCEKYCQDGHKLEIIYTNSEGEEINLICIPKETVYLKKRVCIKTLGNNGSRIYEIPIESIKSINQLPTAAGSSTIPTTVVFKIKGRLAKNYKLRDWEYVQSIEPDGSQIIINKNEDLDFLLKRLMKYGKQCELVSPKFMRDEMINLINKTLSNYQ